MVYIRPITSYPSLFDFQCLYMLCNFKVFPDLFLVDCRALQELISSRPCSGSTYAAENNISHCSSAAFPINSSNLRLTLNYCRMPKPSSSEDPLTPLNACLYYAVCKREKWLLLHTIARLIFYYWTDAGGLVPISLKLIFGDNDLMYRFVTIHLTALVGSRDYPIPIPSIWNSR